MRLISYRQGSEVRGGVLVDDDVYDLSGLFTSSGDGSVRGLLAVRGGELAAISARLNELVAAQPGARVGHRGDLTLAAPVPDPSKVLCVGLNYMDHVAETGRALPEHPDLFAKFASTMIGPDEEIRGAHVSGNLDFEGEVAIVIGRTASGVTEADALNYVAGLAPLNDVTARDLQYRGTQWLAGKAVDGSTPWGPALVTLDEVGDPQTLDVVTRVNGTEMQRSNTRYQIFPIAKIVEYVSSFLTLQPGDVIATGTPQGIGAKRTPPIWLQPGDEVEIDVERVGTLRNRVGGAR